MGDRANVQMRTNNDTGEGMYLYTHWGGTELPEDLRQALIAGKGRWGDDIYLSRIIVSRVVGDRWQEETGYGLSTYVGDNEHPIIVVDHDAQTVTMVKEMDRDAVLAGPWTFAEYITEERRWPDRE